MGTPPHEPPLRLASIVMTPTPFASPYDVASVGSGRGDAFYGDGRSGMVDKW